jgi:CxxC motif-containing protein (DUF1111 family)
MGLPGCTPADPEVPGPEWMMLEPGDPVPGLSTEALEQFERGRELFSHVFTPEEGLGPVFAATACNACHTDPVAGGVATDESMYVTRASTWSEQEGCDLLLDEGGDFVRQRATPALEELGILGDRIPDGATQVTSYRMLPLFGLGLVEAIPDDEILVREDPFDLDRDGIAGRAPRDAEGQVARFTRKGFATTLPQMVEESIVLDLGLTTPGHPRELGPNRGPLPSGLDPVPNPEVSQEEVDAWTAFIRFLAPISPLVPEDPEQQRVVALGRRLFDAVGCNQCHTPFLKTGPSEVPALDRQRVYLYSDLLLHDMGEELASTCGPTASPTEFRTEMLWGLRFRDQFMHDGRARTVREAIELHGGTSGESRERFRNLSPTGKLAVIRFLDTL